MPVPARLALTFDDGPAEWTEPILDLLAAHGAHATFFVIGSLVEERVDTVRRIASEGHEVGNHTWSHPWLARDCDDEQVETELERTNAVLSSILGFPPQRFRAPRYDVDVRVIEIGRRLGLSHTPGDIRPPDWDARCTPGFIATFVLQQARAHAIVGLHDGVPPARRSGPVSRLATVRGLEIALPRLVARGFELVTVASLDAA